MTALLAMFGIAGFIGSLAISIHYFAADNIVGGIIWGVMALAALTSAAIIAHTDID